MNSPSPNSLLEGYPGRWGVTRPTSLKIFQGFGGLAEDVRLQGIQALLGLEISMGFAGGKIQINCGSQEVIHELFTSPKKGDEKSHMFFFNTQKNNQAMTHNCRCLFLEARKSPTNQRLRMHNPWTFTIWPFKTNSYNWPSQRLSTIISSENNIEYTMWIKKSFEILSRHKTGAPPIQWTTPQDQLPNPSTSLNNSAIRGTCEVGHATCRGQPTKKDVRSGWKGGCDGYTFSGETYDFCGSMTVTWWCYDDDDHYCCYSHQYCH